MAELPKIFQNLALEKRNLEDIKQAFEETFFADERFEDFVTIMRVKNTDPIALIGALEDVGWSGSGCDPTYKDVGIANSMKRWELNDWQLPLKICYESLQGSIAEYSLKTGTAIGDLTDTDAYAIYVNALDRAMKQMMWRMAWFGDKDAKNIADGGKLTAGVDVTLFNATDGLFKRLFAIGTAASSQVSALAANSETTFAKQKSALLAQGVATDYLDTFLMDADSRITSDPDAVVLMTKSFADALTYDIKKTYHDIMPWENVFEGFSVANYNGIKIASVSIWDRMIQSYENTGTALNKPHRLVFCNPKQLMVGAPSDSLISDLDAWFDQKERRNYIYATGQLGTAVLEENLVRLGY